MIFNQLDKALNEIESILKNTDQCNYLMFEAFVLNKFVFFNAFIENGMNINDFLNLLLKSYISRTEDIYNRNLNSYKVL